MKRFTNNNQKEKPFLSAKRDLPLWEQMSSFFYTQTPTQNGVSRALVVSHYEQNVGRGKPINLAVGGYVKGESAESLAGRKHELYSMSSGWENRVKDIELLILCGVNAQKSLDVALYIFGNELKKKEGDDKKSGKNSNLVEKLKAKSKHNYFNNSEQIMHSILRSHQFGDVDVYKNDFVRLARHVFDQLVLPYEHDPKLLSAIVVSRARLNAALKKIGEN